MKLATPKTVGDLREGMRFQHKTLEGRTVEFLVDGLERVGSKRRYFLKWNEGDRQRGQIFLRESMERL